MIPAPTHIQEALDREFPGVRLEWSCHHGHWVLTDDFFHVDGTLAYDGWVATPKALQGIEIYPLTQRKVIFVLGELGTDIRYQPHVDRILDTLRKAHRGVRPEQVEEWLDEIEASEERAEARAKNEQREAGREAAGAAWDGMRRSMFSRAGVRTAWTYQRAVDKKYSAEQRARENEGSEEAEAEIKRMVKRGQYTMFNRAMGARSGAASH